MQDAALNVQHVIDGQPLSKSQISVAVLCAASLLADGFDAQAIGFVAPALAAQWHLSRAELSPILTSGLVGMLVGALLFGPLADRFGRKRILILCTLWFGVCSLLTALAGSSRSLILLRLVTGLGLGGTMPNAVALTSEDMPKRLRATGVMLMFTSFPVGAAAGGFVTVGLVSRFGFQSVFLVGGVLPCVIALLLLGLPESIRFLVLKGGHEETIAKLLRKIAPRLRIPQGTSLLIAEGRDSGFVVKRLFLAGRARVTLLLWLVFFMSLLDLFFLNSWLPTVIHDAGFVLQTAISITAMFQVGGAMGALVLGRFIGEGSFRILAWAYLAAGACVLFVGTATASLFLETLAVFAAGFFVIGAQTGANSLAADSYPTSVRSTGIGWALGIGRIGSIAGPIVGGMLLTSHLEVKRVFWAASVPCLIAAVAAGVVNLLPKPKVTDVVSTSFGVPDPDLPAAPARQY